MKLDPIYELLERIAALLRASEREIAKIYGLQPVHIHCLRYLARCNRYSDTPAALTEYLGATKGSVSQSLIVLEKHGLIEKHDDSGDKRQVHITVSRQGLRVLRACAPPPALNQALKELHRNVAQAGLEEVLRAMQRASGNTAFGICKTCLHFRQRALGGRHQCGLTGEPLSEKDAALICREHTRVAGGP